MRIGYSLTTSEIVAADHADYGDCARYQITCPRCREAVFKGKRSVKGSETHYFSHYHAGSDEARECEMRVARLAQKYLGTFAIEGHGQTLAQFMAIFRESIVQGQAEMGIVPYETLWRDANRITARPDFEFFEKPLRKLTNLGFIESCRQSPEFNARENLATELAKFPPFAGRSRFWLRRQASYGLDVLTHIVTPQAGRSFRFAAACVYSLMARTPDAYPTPDGRPISEYTRKVCQALREGWSPTKTENLLEMLLSHNSVADARRQTAAELCDRKLDLITKAFSGAGAMPSGKAALLASAGGRTTMSGRELPSEIVIAVAEAERAALEIEVAKLSKQMRGQLADLAILGLAADLWSPFMGLVSGAPIRRLEGAIL